MAKDKIKLARQRNTSYFVKHPDTGKQWSWAGSKNGKVDSKDVPLEVVEYLQTSTLCFDLGELVIVGNDEKSKEIKDGIVEAEQYENNTHSRKEIEELLDGNTNKMKAELEKITVDSEKQFVIEVASEKKDDLTKGKLDFLASWMNVDSSILFGE